MKKLGTILISVSVLLTLLVPMFVVPASAASDGANAPEVKIPGYYCAQDFSSYTVGVQKSDAAEGVIENDDFKYYGEKVEIVEAEGGKALKWTGSFGSGAGTAFPMANQASLVGEEYLASHSLKAIAVRFSVNKTGAGDSYLAPQIQTADQGYNDYHRYMISIHNYPEDFPVDPGTGAKLPSKAYTVSDKGVKTEYTFVDSTTAGSIWKDQFYAAYDTYDLPGTWMVLPVEYFAGLNDDNVDNISMFKMHARTFEATFNVTVYEAGYIYDMDAFYDSVLAPAEPVAVNKSTYYAAQDFSGYTEPDNTIEGAVNSAIVTDTDGGKALQVTKTAVASHFVGFPVQTPKQASGLDATPRAVAIKVNSPETNGRYKYATFAAANSYDDMQTNEKTFLCSYQSDLSLWGANNTKDVTFYQVSDAGVKRTVEMKAGTTYAWHHTLLSTSDTSDLSDAFSGWIVMPVEGFKDGFDVMSMGYARFHVLYHENVPYTISEVGYVYDLDAFFENIMDSGNSGDSEQPEQSEGPLGNESAGILDMEVLPDDRQGLRFTHTLKAVKTDEGDKVVIDDVQYAVKTIGSLVATADYLTASGKPLTVGAAATDSKIMSAAAESYRSVVKDGDKRTYKFTSLIKNIGKANKAVDVSARAFVICEDAEGNEKIFYGPVITKNVQQVYDAAVAGGHEFNAAVDSWMA